MYSVIFEQLNYELYLAEQQLHDQLSVLSIKYNGIITESNMEVVTEDVKEVIMTYINKVVTSIQNVWNKFKELINNGRWEQFKKEYGKYLDSNFILKINDDNFLVPNFQELDNLLKLSYSTNLENVINDLDSEEAYLSKQFTAFYEKGKSIKKVAEEKILVKIPESEKTITRENLGKYVKFLDTYKSKAGNISKDINNLNTATRSVNQIISTNTIGEMVNLSEAVAMYFHEEENEKKDDKKQSTFSSGTPEGQRREATEKIKDMQKKVNIYFKVTTSVLSAKLAMMNKVEKICFNIAKNYALLASKESGVTSSTTDKKENVNSDNTPQVKV